MEVPFSKWQDTRNTISNWWGREAKKLYLTSWGIQEKVPEDGFMNFFMPMKRTVSPFLNGAKARFIIRYFRRGSATETGENDPEGCVDWGSAPDRDHYMGGDLRGIRSRLDYLEDLDVQCLYLTPIFRGDFNHKYATTDYFEVDPSFGTKEELAQLVDACHKKGIRIRLDGVFNHCGIHFPPFQDLLEKQEASPYKDWFIVTDFPVTLSHHSYECVGAYKWMPKLNTSNREVREFVLSVMDYWIDKFHIDGWRLDVSDEVDGSVWTQAEGLS